MFTIWSMSDCIWCDKAKELMYDWKIDFEEHAPPLQELRVQMRALGVHTLPQIFDNDGELIGGYKDLEEYIKFRYITDDAEYAKVMAETV